MRDNRIPGLFGTQAISRLLNNLNCQSEKLDKVSLRKLHEKAAPNRI